MRLKDTCLNNGITEVWKWEGARGGGMVEVKKEGDEGVERQMMMTKSGWA